MVILAKVKIVFVGFFFTMYKLHSAIKEVSFVINQVVTLSSQNARKTLITHALGGKSQTDTFIPLLIKLPVLQT